MPIQLYNTLAREKQTFVPANPAQVTLYVCGPTVYNYAHIGNARPPVVFDILRRLLEAQFGSVLYARNITDIDDKINKAAAEQGVSISAITEKFANIYRNDMAALGVLPPTVEPKVTDHVPEIIAMIDELIALGSAYEAEGHVLFSVPSFDDYGQLSRKDRDELVAGARIDVAPYKRDAADFVLWKPSEADQPGWDSPWGRGRPGWHIECSAMAKAHLGTTFDIHGGGLDLIFPHHENEIAQSRCCNGGAPMARFWVHNGFVNVNAEKMSKSIGNVLLVHDLLAQAPGEVIRLALLSAHYRQPLDWTDEVLPQAHRALDRLYGGLRALADIDVAVTQDTILRDAPQDLVAALEDDLNTPKAMAALFQAAKAANIAKTPDEKRAAKRALLAGGWLLGLLQQSPEDWFRAVDQGGENTDGLTPEKIDALVADRQAARASRDFAEADRIRDLLTAHNIQIEDSPTGPRWRRA